ncbi:MAG: hypothetical protein ACE5Q6_10215 [Dehalococcoidia bacterium]
MPLRSSRTYWLIRWLPQVLLIALAIVWAAGYLPAYANGRATLVASEERGPYLIDVSILPAQAIVHNTHVSILLRSASDDTILTEAAINISGVGPDSATDFGPIPAPNDIAPQFFEADLPFDLEGEWTVTLEVSSELGEETLQVSMNVRQGGADINWILMAAIVVAILAAGIWTWDRVTGRHSQPDEAEAEAE